MSKETVYVISYLRTNIVKKIGNDYVPQPPKRTVGGLIFATKEAAQEAIDSDIKHKIAKKYSILPKLHKITVDL